MLRHLIGILLLGSVCLAHEKIREKDLKVLTLQDGLWTKSRRGKPVPQLECISGPCSYGPKSVQCTAHYDGLHTNWACKGQMRDGVQFGALDVNCEGYDYPDDPYITYGSCGLRYELVGSPSSSGSTYEAKYNTNSRDEGSFSSVLFWAVVIILFIWFFKSSAPTVPGGDTGHSDDYPGGNGGRGGRYGGGGGPSSGPGFRPEFGAGPGCGGTQPNYHQNDGPGFWSGIFTGGLLGYMFGGNNTGYGGGYERAYRRRNYYDDGYSGGGFGGGFSGGSAGTSSSFSESTGYARTSRR